MQEHQRELQNFTIDEVLSGTLPYGRGSLSYDPKLAEQGVSLGKTLLRLHGVEREMDVVVLHNFTPGYSDREGRMLTAIIPEPYGDNYLNGLSAMALAQGERTFCLPLLPGSVELYEREGVLNGGVVHELPYDAAKSYTRGFPDSDVVSALEENQIDLSEFAVFFAFPTEYARQQVNSLGGLTLQDSDPRLTNNKADFREAADRYGFRVAPGMTITTLDDISRAVNFLEGEDTAWLKLCRGSGGDLVIKLRGPIEEEELIDGIARLYVSTREAFAKNSFSSTAEEYFWPEGASFPRDGTIILEKNAGKIAVNGSSLVLISDDGRYCIPSYFEQMTENGAYLGSRPYTPPEEVREQLQEQTEKIARYAFDRGIRGIVGTDFLVIEEGEELSVVNIELNGRPPISSTAFMLGEKMREIHGHTDWININAYAPGKIYNIEDFEAVFRGLEEDGISQEDGLVTPQAFRTQYSRAEGDENYLADDSHASNAVKILISGRGKESCQRVLEVLRSRGVTF